MHKNDKKKILMARWRSTSFIHIERRNREEQKESIRRKESKTEEKEREGAETKGEDVAT